MSLCRMPSGGGGSLKQGGQVPPAVGEAVGELKTVVRLDALHPDAPACIPLLNSLFRKSAEE